MSKALQTAVITSLSLQNQSLRQKELQMDSDAPLLNRLIALPESRQLDVLADMLEKRGARLVRCPMVSILDAVDAVPINAWLQRCIESPHDYFIILTGEGIRRLRGFAERFSVQPQWLAALQRMRKLTRGPKPVQALKEAGLKADIQAQSPTTEGVIATLQDLQIENKRVAVQLYGEEPNHKLIDYLTSRGALADTVAPYRYAPRSDDERVVALIDQLAAGEIDAITFTSSPQYRRLAEVADKTDRQTQLTQGLASTVVAAVGPVVAEELRSAGVRVDLMPEDSFFMKPMVTRLIEVLNAG
jgi:uroporphyrinogen-III synthase